MSANVQAAPVNEVVLSVCFQPEELLAGPLLSETLGPIFADRTSIQTVVPYTMPLENERPWTTQLPFELQQVSADPRYWIIARENAYVTQVQTTYLALNWRRQDPGQEYVHYEELRRRFVSTVETIRANLAKHDRSLNPIQAELTYVNVISPDANWADLGEAHRIFQFTAPSIQHHEYLAFSFANRMTDTGGRFVGRLHVNMQPGMDPLKDEPRLNLNITARSAALVGGSDSYLSFLDAAHDLCNATFLDLLTPAAKENWGLV
jgi:uncharacterized protein (TIGR04255 family)